MTAPSTPATISRSTLESILDGTVIGPDDSGYDNARTVFSGAIDRRPALIARVANATDVAHVVAVARDGGLELAVRSGGHSGAGHGVTEGGIVLDLSGMRALEIDVKGRTAWAETGLTAGEYTDAAGAHGLATGFGDAGSVGIGGITLGGGAGFLVRKHGLTIDDLLAAVTSSAAPMPKRTRISSGRSVGAAATSALRPGSSLACTRSGRSSAGCCFCPRRPR